jgi:cell division topological specificity factor
MGFLQRLMGRETSGSSETAKQRLQLVLIHDRSNISPGLLDLIKDEIINVISRHIEIERESVKINFTQQGSESRLVADIPLGSATPGRQSGSLSKGL